MVLLCAFAFPDLAAQERIDFAEFDLCNECRLTLTEVIRLGTDHGSGIVEHEWTRATWDQKLGFATFAGTRINLYDRDGRFQRALGREGEGPGEFRAISDVHIAAGRIIALDFRTRAWSLFDENGTFVTRRPYPGPLGRGRFRMVGSDTVVVAAINRRDPDAVGYPLHLTTLARDAPVTHFGTDSPRWVPNEPYASIVILGTLSARGAMWWAKPARPHLEEWSLEGNHRRTVAGKLPWFHEYEPSGPLARRPLTRLGYFGVDGDDRLWMMTEVPDPEWGQIEFVRTEEGWIPKDDVRPDQLRDARLDIFDLRQRTHLGWFTWDDVYPALMDLGGELAVSAVEYDPGLVPRVVIYRLETGGAR